MPAQQLGGASGQNRPPQRCRRVREADLGPEVPDRHAEVVGPPELVVPERPQCSVPHCDLDTGNQRDEQDDARGVDQASPQADPQAKVPAAGGRRARVQRRGDQHNGSARRRHATFESMSHRPRAAEPCGGARRGRQSGLARFQPAPTAGGGPGDSRGVCPFWPATVQNGAPNVGSARCWTRRPTILYSVSRAEGRHFPVGGQGDSGSC